MLRFMTRRLLLLIPTLLAISMVSFAIINLPPGDYLTSYMAALASNGESIDPAQLQAFADHYGLGQPIYVQYFKWMSGILLHGDFGQSMEWQQPVAQVLWNNLGLTLIISISTLLFTWIVAFPLGVYSAVRQYSIGDYIATFLGFLGLAVPDFLLALVLMYLMFSLFHQDVGGLFSPDYAMAPWSLARFWDLMKHIWIAIVLIGASGVAGLTRIVRANLLDELHKPYVVTARAKGLPEYKLLIKYPVRQALNPFVSTVGWHLPSLISGSVIVSIVLGLPINGPLLLKALQTKDMYLAGSFVMMLSVLTVIGTLLSDILLAWLDPRIRLE